MFTKDIVYIAGIDPGGNTGLSIIGLNPMTLSIESIETYVFVLDSYSTETNLVNRLETIDKIIYWLIEKYQPKMIGMESAFLNVRYPKAIITLSSYTTMLEYCINKYGIYTELIKYPPKYIKKIICSGDANKDDMMTGVGSILEITNKMDVGSKTEHEIDATAIAYVVIQEIRNYPYVLYKI